MPCLPERGGSESEDDEPEVMLGYVDTPRHPRDLLRHRFPSKVGGNPAWLDPLHLPSREQLTCPVTGQAMRFLLQVYAPVDTHASAFHRTLFLFVSPQGDQLTSAGAVRALRCQLPRTNPYYSSEPPGPRDHAPPALEGGELQLALERDPWRVAEAEAAAAAAPASSAASSGGGVAGCGAGPLRYPEQELAVEPEPWEGDSEGGETGAEVRRLVAEYEAREAEEGELSAEELPAEVVDGIESALSPEQAAFAAFQVRVARAPSQVLRYCFQQGAEPLWPSCSHRPGPQEVPPCERCGGPRCFELQVMPQLLTFLDLDEEDPAAPDWGTLVVYSCAASCQGPPVDDGAGCSSYVNEVVWVQPS